MGNDVRQQCTAADRKKICELQLAHRDLTQEKLTALIAGQLNLPNIKRSTVTGTLKESHKWLNSADTTADKRVRDRTPQHENLETALMQWFGQLRARNALISDRLLVEKARELAEKLSIADFKASDGWHKWKSMDEYAGKYCTVTVEHSFLHMPIVKSRRIAGV